MKILKWLDGNLEICLVNFLLANIVVWVFVQVVLRYIFSYSLPWSEELVRWCFVWFIWVGVSYAFKVRKHICIDVFVNMLPKKASSFIGILIDLVLLWAMLKIGILGVFQIMNPIILNQSSIVLIWPFSGVNVSMFWLYASLPFGALLSSLRLVQVLVEDIRAFTGHSKSKEA
ncbi:MAG: TRAP transporter small permease [Succinivibrio sp.]